MTKTVEICKARSKSYRDMHRSTIQEQAKNSVMTRFKSNADIHKETKNKV